MSGGEKVDATKTYVLDETAITKVTSIEELAELAMRQTEQALGAEEAEDDRLGSKESAHRTNGPDRRRA